MITRKKVVIKGKGKKEKETLSKVIKKGGK